MKKIISLLLAFLLCTATACGGNAAAPKNTAPQDNAVPQETSAEEDTAAPEATETEDAAQQETPAAENTEAQETPAAEDTAVPETSETVYPITLTDQLGREVTVEAEPQTLVSGYYISTSLLIALGLEDRLVGIEAKAKSRNIYQLSAPRLIDLPSVGTAKEFDLEGCAALEPDLIILPVKLEKVIPSLEELGFTVLAVDPEDEALLEEAVTLLGKATNTAARAQELLAFKDKQLEPLTKTLEGLDKPTVYLASNSALLSAAGANMYQNSLIEQAGGTNAAADIAEDYWAEISYEQLLSWDPDYIILAADAEYTVDSVLQDENLQDLKAVQNGNVYQFPNAIEAWDSPVPSSVLGSMWLASVIHNDRYAPENWQSAVTEYYETFYGFTPDFSV